MRLRDFVQTHTLYTMKPQRITMLAPFGIRPKGTLLARMLPLAGALVRRGYAVTIIAPPVQNPEDAQTRVDHSGVPVVHTPAPTLPGAFGVAQQVWALARAAHAEQPNLVHLFKPKGYSGLATLLLRTLHPHIPLVVDTDDWEGWGGWNDMLPYPYLAKLLFAWQERDLPRRAAAVTVASRTLQTQVWGRGVEPHRVMYVPNGIEGSGVGQLKTQHSKLKTLLLYTRFWEFDLPPLVTALVAIHQQRPDVRLLVVGKGERGEEVELRRLAGRAGIGAMIDDRGWAQPDDMPGYFAQSDVALYPIADRLINRAKSPAKLLEQMAAGLPIVAMHVGEVGAFIEHNQSGLLVPPGDPAAFARAVVTLLGDPQLRAQLGAGAQQRVATHFTWEHAANAVEQAYGVATCSRIPLSDI